MELALHPAAPIFDRVLVRAGDGWTLLSAEQFFALPLSTRVRHVIERTVSFELRGEAVDQRAALSALRRLALPPQPSSPPSPGVGAR